MAGDGHVGGQWGCGGGGGRLSGGGESVGGRGAGCVRYGRGQSNDLPIADAAYDEAQAAVDALRSQADALIKATRAAILYSTYDLDPPSQRRVLRNFGSVYRYLAGEVVDVGDETAVFGEGV